MSETTDPRWSDRCVTCTHLRADHEPDPLTACTACACKRFERGEVLRVQGQHILVAPGSIDRLVQLGLIRRKTIEPPAAPAAPPDVFATEEWTEADPAAADAVALIEELQELRALGRELVGEASTHLTLVASSLARSGRAELGRVMLHAARVLYVVANEHQGEPAEPANGPTA